MAKKTRNRAQLPATREMVPARPAAAANPWLAADHARDEAIARACQAAGPVAGIDDDLWERLASQIDRNPEADISVMLNVAARAGRRLAVDQETVWALTAFRATYAGLMHLTFEEALRHRMHDPEPEPDPRAADLEYLRRLKRRERMAQGTAYWRRLRARRVAAEQRLAD